MKLCTNELNKAITFALELKKGSIAICITILETVIVKKFSCCLRALKIIFEATSWYLCLEDVYKKHYSVSRVTFDLSVMWKCIFFCIIYITYI